MQLPPRTRAERKKRRLNQGRVVSKAARYLGLSAFVRAAARVSEAARTARRAFPTQGAARVRRREPSTRAAWTPSHSGNHPGGCDSPGEPEASLSKELLVRGACNRSPPLGILAPIVLRLVWR